MEPKAMASIDFCLSGEPGRGMAQWGL